MSFLDNLPTDLQSKIKKVTSILPNTLEIFKELYEFGLTQNERSTNDSKRRKLDNSDVVEITSTIQNNIPQDDIIFQLKDVSVLSPLRKKLNLVLHSSPTDKSPMLSLEKDSKIHFSISNLRSDIQMAVFLPVSEKPNLTYLFIKYINSSENTTDHKSYTEPILISLSNDLVLNQFHKLGILDNSVSDFNSCIDYIRKQAILTGFRISNPFNSNSDTLHKSFLINCHRGTKEGTLYFLPDNMIFGFKKPILLFDSNDIESITYSSITRLTFNMTLITKNGEVFEFSMIDQNEYTKIDEYVKRKQVIDKSMSEELKAKTKSNKNNSNSNHDIKNSENNENNSITNDNNGHESILEAATKQLEQSGSFNLNNVDLDSEDNEEIDANFESVESDLSDGSEVEEESEIENDVEEISHPKTYNPQNNVPMDLSSSLKNIPIEIEDDDEEDEDEDEGSGVEYD